MEKLPAGIDEAFGIEYEEQKAKMQLLERIRATFESVTLHRDDLVTKKAEIDFLFTEFKGLSKEIAAYTQEISGGDQRVKHLVHVLRGTETDTEWLKDPYGANTPTAEYLDMLKRLTDLAKTSIEFYALLSSMKEKKLATAERTERLRQTHYKLDQLRTTTAELERGLSEEEEKYRNALRVWHSSIEEHPESTRRRNTQQQENPRTFDDPVMELAETKQMLENAQKRIKALEEECENTKWCYWAGCQILDRRREWNRKFAKQDKAVIELGDKISHHGSSIGDASRFLESQNSEDLSWFRHTYGVTVKEAWQGRTDQGFVAMLDWHAATKYMTKNHQDFTTSVFLKRFLVLKTYAAEWFGQRDGVRGKAGKDWLLYLKEDVPGSGSIEYYREMKKEYEQVFEEDKKQRNGSKENKRKQ